ncbi:FecR family protein [Psychroserpens sp.]|uniref:FecR family protein n=1 Tax=Psychroserpens sp. TaxID=2020870 RepID=UPI00385B7D81
MDREALLKKWLNNELTPAEKREFEQGEDFALNQSIIDTAQQFKASLFSESKSFDSFHQTYKSKTSHAKQIDWFKPLLRIASVVVIALGVYFTFFNSNIIEIETLASQHSTIELPDLSQVTLNAASQITYDPDDWNNNRRLNLKGEAYFKVAKGKTFDVITSKGKVTVVGTEFTVNQRFDYFEVQCFEGIVKVTSGTISKQLLAGNNFRLIDNKLSLDKTTFDSPQWTQNKSVFKALPLKDVIAEIERQYNIKIKVKDVNMKRLFTGGFVHDNIENALLSVTEPMNLGYTIDASNAVLIYGESN